MLGRASEKQLKFVAENLDLDRDLSKAIEDLEDNAENSQTLEMKKPPTQTNTKNKRSNSEIHSQLIKPVNREEWIEKIWKTEKLESHENGEPIEILYWFKYNGAKDKGLGFLKIEFYFYPLSVESSCAILRKTMAHYLARYFVPRVD